MKKALLYFILFFIAIAPMQSFGQWSANNIITFDPGDTLYPHLISIDTINYHHNIWQIGKPNKTVFTSALSLPNAIVTDTLNPYPTNDTSAFILKMPFLVPITGWGLAPTYRLQFSYQLKKDSNSIARLEVSQDNGMNWYNTKDTLPSDFWWDSWWTPNLSDTTTDWTIFEINVDTNPFAITDTFLFRFTFISDSVFAHKDGWIIDNIGLNYYVEGIPILKNTNLIDIYPNPTTTSLTITSSNAINQITITNLLGQTIYSHQYNAEQVQVDVSGFVAGVYFVKVNGVEVRKFVKE